MVELFATVFIWGLSFALAKQALNSLSPFELVTLRLALGGLTAAFLARFFSTRIKEVGLTSRKKWLMAALLGIFEFAGTYILYTWSLYFLPSGVVGTLTLLTPTLTFLVGLFFKVHMASWRNFGATVLSACGACLCFPLFRIFSSFGSIETRGALWGFSLLMLSNLSFALGNILISRWDQKREWRNGLTAPGLLCGALVAGMVMLFTPRSSFFHEPSLKAWMLPLYLGIIATGLGFFLWNRGVQKTSALKASVIGNFKGPLSVFWGAFLLHESFDLKFWFGLVLLIAATQIISLKPASKS